MQLTSKEYKLNKIKHYVRNKNILLICLTNETKSQQLTIVKQANKRKELETFHPNNTLLKKYLKLTTLSPLSAITTGSYLFLTFTKRAGTNTPFKQFLKLNDSTVFLALKLNNKIYGNSQLKKLHTLNYNDNIKLLHGCLYKTLKLCNVKFKK